MDSAEPGYSPNSPPLRAKRGRGLPEQRATNAGADSDDDSDKEDMDQTDGEYEELVYGSTTTVVGDAPQMKSWLEVRKQLDDIMRREKARHQIPFSQLRQYQLLQEFANLRVKGRKAMEASFMMAEIHKIGTGRWFARQIRSLARYYREHNQLPPEHRGGLRRISCRLYDDDVERAARAWLGEQKLGTVTPASFRTALNNEIFPNLSIILKKPLCNRTARRWLVKLGYRRTVLRKGIYMDGHERPDVVAYRNDSYLPKLQSYEARMVQYHGPNLEQRPPVLKPGEKQIIANFHDECSFHANEFKTSAWYVPICQ